MTDLTLRIIQVGFLALLWLMVLAVAAVMRRDLFARRRSRPPKPVKPPKPAKAVKPPKAPSPDKPAPEPKPRRGAPRVLMITAGSREGTALDLGGEPISIGRSPENTLVLDDDYVSGKHARIYRADGSWVVEDLGSTNGTYVERARLTGPYVLAPGTPVRIGKTVLELRK